MGKLTVLSFGACCALMLCGANAQTPGAIRQLDSVQQRQQIEQTARPYEENGSAPELYPGESSDVGPQSILKFKPRRTYVEAMADAQYFYTDNMFLNEQGRQDSDVLVGTAQLALAPTPYDLGGGKLAPRVGYRHQWFMFGLAKDSQVTVFDFGTGTFRQADLNEFDFNAQTIFTDARWISENWTLEAGLDFTRLMDTSNYDQFYREFVPRWGVHRLFPLNETKAFSIGYEGDYRFADTDLPPPSFASDFNSRTDHSLVAAYAHSLCKNAIVQPYYRFKYTHFTEGDHRDDYLHSFGLALHCFFTPQISLRAFAGYDILESSNPSVPDYKRLDAGGGLNLTFRF
jgi:hypothetical protein